MRIKLGTAEYLRAQACKNSTQALKCSCNHAQRCLHAFTTLPGQPASPAHASTWHPGRSAHSFHSLPTLPPRSAPPSSYCHHMSCLPLPHILQPSTNHTSMHLPHALYPPSLQTHLRIASSKSSGWLVAASTNTCGAPLLPCMPSICRRDGRLGRKGSLLCQAGEAKDTPTVERRAGAAERDGNATSTALCLACVRSSVLARRDASCSLLEPRTLQAGRQAGREAAGPDRLPISLKPRFGLAASRYQELGAGKMAAPRQAKWHASHSPCQLGRGIYPALPDAMRQGSTPDCMHCVGVCQ
jgi:hypothetical protein